MSTHLVVVSLVDRAGELGRASRCLSEADVDIEGFSVGPGGARFLTQDADEAMHALGAAGFEAESHEVAAVRLPNHRGQLARVCEQLAHLDINIEHGFGVTHGGEGMMYIRVDDLPKAAPVLKQETGVVIMHRGLRRI